MAPTAHPEQPVAHGYVLAPSSHRPVLHTRESDPP